MSVPGTMDNWCLMFSSCRNDSLPGSNWTGRFRFQHLPYIYTFSAGICRAGSCVNQRYAHLQSKFLKLRVTDDGILCQVACTITRGVGGNLCSRSVTAPAIIIPFFLPNKKRNLLFIMSHRCRDGRPAAVSWISTDLTDCESMRKTRSWLLLLSRWNSTTF